MLKRVSVGLPWEIMCQTREHVQLGDVRDWRDRRSRHYLIKDGGGATGDREARLLSLKGLSAPVVTLELAKLR